MNVFKILQLSLLLCGTFSISEAQAMEEPDLESLSIACKERGFEIIDEATRPYHKISAHMVQECSERMALVQQRKNSIQARFDTEFSMSVGTALSGSAVIVKACMLVTPDEFSDILMALREQYTINFLMNPLLTAWDGLYTNINFPVRKYCYLLNQNDLEGKEAYDSRQRDLNEQAIIAAADLPTFYGEGEKPMLRTHFFSLAVDLGLLNKALSCANPENIKERLRKDADSILSNAYASEKDKELALNVRKSLDQ